MKIKQGYQWGIFVNFQLERIGVCRTRGEMGRKLVYVEFGGPEKPR
jgi:hypothetical protein